MIFCVVKLYAFKHVLYVFCSCRLVWSWNNWRKTHRHFCSGSVLWLRTVLPSMHVPSNTFCWSALFYIRRTLLIRVIVKKVRVQHTSKNCSTKKQQEKTSTKIMNSSTPVAENVVCLALPPPMGDALVCFWHIKTLLRLSILGCWK